MAATIAKAAPRLRSTRASAAKSAAPPKRRFGAATGAVISLIYRRVSQEDVGAVVDPADQHEKWGRIIRLFRERR